MITVYDEIESIDGEYYKVMVTADPDLGNEVVSVYFGSINVAVEHAIPAGETAEFCFRADGSVAPLQVEYLHQPVFKMYRIRKNPHVVWDGTGITLNYNGDVNRWTRQVTYRPEQFGRLPNLMCSFKDGNLYLHNSEERAKFYGVQYPWSVSVLTKDNMPATKQPKWISLEGGGKPSYAHIRTEKPYTQSSDLGVENWESKEGRLYAAVLRDRTTPGRDPIDSKTVLNGDTIIGDYVMVAVEFPDGGSYINAINIHYNDSKGHR